MVKLLPASACYRRPRLMRQHQDLVQDLQDEFVRLRHKDSAGVIETLLPAGPTQRSWAADLWDHQCPYGIPIIFSMVSHSYLSNHNLVTKKGWLNMG